MDNTTVEGNRAATVTATASDHAAGSATFTIIDENGGPPVANWSTASQVLTEDAVFASVTAQLSSTAPSQVTIPITVDGSSTTGTDFEIADPQIVIPSGENAGTLRFAIYDDDGQETEETVVLTMGTLIGAIQGPTRVHTVTIQDDDAPGNVDSGGAAQRRPVSF